ncbi:MAG: sulfide/dihydroorotate dehydrogenase-like FAD/NAD-binding protein [Nitrospiraceae bacterium]|nr:MAG: sulfide/dihydroorotate dehydrogenase-like FAD/NAD-binding protein [Nitrospiraceae bacterium]
MYKVLNKETVAPQVDALIVNAPYIASHAKAGNFIVLRIHEKGERIPLTIADSDLVKGTITLLFQKIGKTTEELGTLKKGDTIRDIAGPLGHDTPLKKYGHAVLVGGGIGSATLFPILKALKDRKNKVTVILGARNKAMLVWQDRFAEYADEIILITDDGSSGKKGLVTEALKEVADSSKIDVVLAVGPIRMMQAVAELTRPSAIKTYVSLNPVMVEGTGMCGACRVSIAGKTKFACIDGPEFDAHDVDFEEIAHRLNFYKDEETESIELFKKKKCKGKCKSKSKMKN